MSIVLLPPWVAIVVGRFYGVGALPIGAAIGFGGGVLAVVLGVVGIFRTRRRVRRGRGMAIAAIPIGLVAGLLQAAVGNLSHQMVTATQFSMEATEILRASTSERHAKAAEWYETRGSARFKAALTIEEFEAWLNEVLDRLGQLQHVSRDQKLPTPEKGVLIVNLGGRFVNGTARITIRVGLDDGKVKVDDLVVGDSSPLN